MKNLASNFSTDIFKNYSRNSTWIFLELQQWSGLYNETSNQPCQYNSMMPRKEHCFVYNCSAKAKARHQNRIRIGSYECFAAAPGRMFYTFCVRIANEYDLIFPSKAIGVFGCESFEQDANRKTGAFESLLRVFYVISCFTDKLSTFVTSVEPVQSPDHTLRKKQRRYYSIL